MRKATFYITALFLCSSLFVSCYRQRNHADYTRLQQWDAALQEQPKAVGDSLRKVMPKELSRANRAYYGLLKTIADDKNYADFVSDSLINSVENYYRRHNKACENHIRSLIYQGIVRYRLGITDSTAFAPLKEAEQWYVKQPQPNFSTGYIMYYYLGELLAKNNSRQTAHSYYNKALRLAEKANSNRHIFDAYIRLYWNEMIQENYDKGKQYLDSLNKYVDESLDNQFSVFNATSVYFDTQEDYQKELEYEKAQLSLIPFLKEAPDLYRIYYSLSNTYTHNNRLDSAMFYARKAIEHIADSTYKLNYLLYENVADIAEAQHNLSLALQYRKKAFKVYENTIDKRLNTQILEVEKRYNLAEAENRALKAQARMRITIGIALLLLLMLATIIFDWDRRRKITRLEKANVESKLLLAQRQADENRRIIGVVLPYLNLHAAQQQELLAFANKIRAKDGAMADRYEQLLKTTRQHFDETTQHLFTDELLSETLKTEKGLEILNQTDRMLLFMLAVGAENQHIVALLNTTPDNLKSKKTYLKKKIQRNTSYFDDNAEALLRLF